MSEKQWQLWPAGRTGWPGTKADEGSSDCIQECLSPHAPVWYNEITPGLKGRAWHDYANHRHFPASAACRLAVLLFLKILSSFYFPMAVHVQLQMSRALLCLTYSQDPVCLESDTPPPTVGSHCSQNERALAGPEAHGVSACARQGSSFLAFLWLYFLFYFFVELCPLLPLHPLMFPFTRQGLESGLILDNRVLVVVM